MFYSKAYRFHQAVTGRGSVAGIHVNVLAPEAFWTVIGIAVPLDGGATLCAGEIFNVALKFFLQARSSKTYLVVCYHAHCLKENNVGNLTNKETEILKGLFFTVQCAS